MAANKWILLPVLLACAALGTARAADPSPENWDGLVQVKGKRMDVVFLLPGADFRQYTKVMLDPTEVAFDKDWMKNINRDSPGVSNDVNEADMTKIAAEARSNFGDIWKEAFEKAGYQVVTTPASDVLRVSTGIANLYINAPDVQAPGRSRTYTMEAGEATLVMEVRDSLTNALLGRVIDRRETQSTGMMQLSSSVSNLSDFRLMFKSWAGITTKGMEELKAHSPVPADLKAGQKLN